MRKPAQRVKPRIARTQSFPAPTGGWIANTTLAAPQARRPDGTKVNGAAMLENWFPTATGIKMRGGSGRHAILGDGSSRVTALFSYVNGNTRQLFGATETAIYNVTSPLYSEDQFYVDGDGNFLVDLDGNFIILAGSPSEEVSSTGGDWSVVQFATSGGTFLRLVNGEDTPLIYDGATWGTSPAITGATPTTLSFVWSYKNRLFFVQKDTLDAWYLPVDTVGGAAVKFPLGGVFTLGGSLMFGASWSLDTGSGLSGQCAFFSTEGEVAVYQGSDPSDAADWKLVGVYKIGRPRGPKAWIRAGGDIVIATDIGFVPLSQAIQRDVAALSPAAVSYPIEDEWNIAVRDRTEITWQCTVWPTNQMVVVALPTSSGRGEQMFVANARTGAWARYTGWGATCLEPFGDRLFFGTEDGRIIEADVTGADQSATYTATCVPLFDPMKTPAALKMGLQARVVFRATSSVNERLSLQKDYTLRLPAAPDATAGSSNNLWGTGQWGSSVWGGTAELSTEGEHDWHSTPGSGYALSVATQVTSGSTEKKEIEIVQTDLLYDLGDVGS